MEERCDSAQVLLVLTNHQLAAHEMNVAVTTSVVPGFGIDRSLYSIHQRLRLGFLPGGGGAAYKVSHIVDCDDDFGGWRRRSHVDVDESAPDGADEGGVWGAGLGEEGIENDVESLAGGVEGDGSVFGDSGGGHGAIVDPDVEMGGGAKLIDHLVEGAIEDQGGGE